jgi:mannose/cellobiose epimerase-like protein (N-acyl-D-glucosamine 2-epimerase family)
MAKPAADRVLAAAATPSFAPAPTRAPPCSSVEQLQAIQARLRALRGGILSFWLKHGVDETYGGFHGTLERGGRVGKPADKGIVPQCRHVWAMSRAVLSGALPAGTADARAAEAAARSAWRFMVDHLHRADRPGTW